ncbi:S8 family serine peptidase [Streptomyces sp. 35G-GA-8]|uniref:S8 family serine peptidase n=1 Tax=Streptomyces sp. 35G-GA-8 TaxID=2939434 RepID=UPI00201F2D92|nr:S8 family serine peptidase [Streptomyces sp. 35G-GA-8]MCL7376826.1 S8 family serine peptidase [Streptomyces sp. 35G-GA-8]
MTRAPARRGARLLAAGLSLVLLPAGQAVAAGAGHDPTPADAVPPSHATARAAHTVTLVTGDKVTVTDVGGGRRTVAVQRPEGATGAVRSETSGDRITVVPDEAAPYLSAGALDKRLFDVTALIELGYDDRGADALPLIVTYGKGSRAATPLGADRVRSLPSVNGAAVEASKNGTDFWRTVAPAARSSVNSGAREGISGEARFAAGIERIWLDGRVTADMAESNAQIGTPKAWEAGLTGKGVKVAVLDTGVDAGHPDLAGRVDETKSFIEGEEVTDRRGHGTHVTSTVGGSGAASDGKEKGVAPGAGLAVGKVLSDAGFGSESQIIAGMEWAAKDIDAKIVSMSLGSTEPSDGTDPMAQAVNTLSEQTGALFVIAAGNSGGAATIGSPGAADSALTIGAVDSADRPAYFTSQGPRHGDNALKPDLSAPGVDILAARSRLAEGSGPYTTMSGTSMATPHVAGVAALLAEKHPDWSGQRLKDALMSTSEQLTDSVYALGAGRVDVPAAVDAVITATGSADLGFHSWPYEDNKPVTRTVGYANSSDGPVTLSLAVEGAADGVVTLADSTLTVPAHGTATTTVTGDGTKAPVGTTSGRVVARSGDTVVAHTAFGLVKEEERYTLTVHAKDRDGAPTAAPLTVQKLAAGHDPFPAAVGDSGTLQLRVAPGSYAVSSFLDVRGGKGKDSLGLGFLSAPEVVMDRDREITLDGSQLREIRAEVDRRTETRQLLMEFSREANGATFAGAVQVPLAYDSVFAAPTREPATGTFEYRTVWRLGKPLLELTAGGRRIAETVVQYGSALPDGRQRLPLVDAGTGSSGEYEGLSARGKAVVVRASAAVSPGQLAQNAQDAGVKALFVTDDAPGRLLANFATESGEERPLTIATVNSADGALLLESAREYRSVELTGTRYTPYVYDLSEGHPGAIPKDLTYRPGKRELAVLDTRFHAAEPVDGGEFRYSLTDTFPIGFGFPEKTAYPAERTDYVSTGAGQHWHESVTAGPTSLEQRGGVVTYRGGTHSGLDWFKPVLHPWLGTGLGWGQQRRGNDLRFNTPGWGDSGPDHTGFGDVWSDESMTQTTEVYANGRLVDRRTSSGAYAWDADPAEQTYKVVTDTTLDPERWRLSTRGHSEWTFRSARTPVDRETFLPLLNLGFDVDTDLAGDVRAGKRLSLGIFSEYVKGAPDTGRIDGGRLEVSYDDGKSWTAVSLHRAAGKPAAWEGTVRIPKDAAYLSLRASATDDRGGSVKQEIIRAVGVK